MRLVLTLLDRENLLRTLHGRWRSLKSKPSTSPQPQLPQSENVHAQWHRSDKQERDVINAQKKKWAEEEARLEAKRRAADERLDANFNAVRSGLDDAIAMVADLEHRESLNEPLQWPKIVGTTLLAFVALTAAIATAFQQAGIVNVFLAHLILLFGWLGFMGSFLLLERVVSLPPRRMVKATIIVGFISGLFMLGMDRWMVYLKVQANPSTEGSASISPPSTAPNTTERIFIDITPEQLVGFYKKYNSAQADDLVKPYISQWVKVSGSVNDVNREKGFTEPDTVRLSLAVEDANGWIVYAVLADFNDQRWMNRALVFRKDEKATVVGKIKRVMPSGMAVVNCEIVE